MTLQEEARAIEATLRERGVGIDAVLRSADVDRSTWTRWKGGKVQARYDTWARVKAAVHAATEAEPARA